MTYVTLPGTGSKIAVESIANVKYQLIKLLDGTPGSETPIGTSANPLNVTASTATVYALRMDEGATYTYIGEAAAGSAEGSALWRIKRLTNATNTIVWADGNTSFDNVWDDRAGASYS